MYFSDRLSIDDYDEDSGGDRETLDQILMEYDDEDSEEDLLLPTPGLWKETKKRKNNFFQDDAKGSGGGGNFMSFFTGVSSLLKPTLLPQKAASFALLQQWAAVAAGWSGC